MNYYERHIGDYLKDTAHLSLLEHGVYARLMDVYYTREGGIPDDQAARLIGARSKEERDALQAVLGEFFTLLDGTWVQARCDREIARFQDKQAKAKSSAASRWGAHRSQSVGNADASANAYPDAMRTHSEGNAPRARPQSPDTNQKKKHTPQPPKGGKPPDLIDQPVDVAPQVWADWLELRRKKRAPVTATVLDEARKEASKAGMPLEGFLRVWCARGSQGLQAEWLKPQERGTGPPMTAAERRVLAAVPSIADPRLRGATQPTEVIDVPAKQLG